MKIDNPTKILLGVIFSVLLLSVPLILWNPYYASLVFPTIFTCFIVMDSSAKRWLSKNHKFAIGFYILMVAFSFVLALSASVIFFLVGGLIVARFISYVNGKFFGNSQKFAVAAVAVIFFLSFGFFSGLPIHSNVEISGCGADYYMHILPNVLCHIMTEGHCGSGDSNQHNAEARVFVCLCDKYNQTESADVGNAIMEMCMADHNCQSAKEWYTKRGTDVDIKYMCDNKRGFYYESFIW